MQGVIDIELGRSRPIFLHFLNRELLRSVGRSIPSDRFDGVLSLLALANSQPLYTNFSNLLEGDYLREPLSLARMLLESDQIQVVGERPTITEFIESRQNRYAFDASRYPMYFGKTTPDFDIQPQILRAPSDSATSFIAEQMRRLVEHRVTAGLVPVFDEAKISAISPTIRKVLNERSEEALTLSLFERELAKSQTATQQTESRLSIARLLSFFYAKDYLSMLGGDTQIFTGIRGLSYFDDLSSSGPHPDYHLYKTLFETIGLRAVLGSLDERTKEQIAVGRGSTLQISLASMVADCFEVLWEISTSVGGSESLPFVRNRIGAYLRMHGSLVTAAPQGSIVEVAAYMVSALVRKLRENGAFERVYQERIVARNIQKTVLLVTATDTETACLIRVVNEKTGQAVRRRNLRHVVVHELGIIGLTEILHVQTEMGSVGPASAQAVVADVLGQLKIDAVIMCGIAFGLQPGKGKQVLGDVLVATAIQAYERQKVTESRVIARGEKMPVAPGLINRFRSAKVDWTGQALHFGLLMSGEKLSNSKEFVESLLRLEPEAIGGDMEASGLLGAAYREQTAWGVVKAVCDWGFDKTADLQEVAATNAARFVVHTLENTGI